MAPKGLNRAPKVVATSFYPLMDIGVGTDSGWRETDEQRVQDLIDTFKRGEFGINVLANPSILLYDGLFKVDVGGKTRLANGKSAITALQRLKPEIEDLKTSAPTEWPEWFTNTLQQVYDEGVRVDHIEFPEDDSHLVTAWFAMTHDTDSNKFVPTSLKQKVHIVMEQLKLASGDWAVCHTNMMSIYGAGKRSTIYRWTSAAKTIEPEVLQFMNARKYINQGYVLENKYFVGAGADSKMRLSESYKIKVVNIAY